MLKITTRPVTEANWRTAIELDVHPEQREFTPTVAISLAKAYIQPDGAVHDPVAVYAGPKMVGFYSFIYLPNNLYFAYLGGFLIDKSEQGRGYGRAALALFLHSVKRRQPECKEVLLTVNPRNQVAQRLYQSVGFVKTGDSTDGEDVMRLVLKSPG
ncbi:MAG: GNAT family N-acetyltransferase [Chloroflexi bacterium]|nr:GNAT family N-acetyltransferase [Chloroflexota bacterium]